MLKEGSNLSNIEIGVMIQLDGNEGSFIQKSGRIMRAENPVIFLFYFKNTKDEEYLENVLREVNPEHVKVISQNIYYLIYIQMDTAQNNQTKGNYIKPYVILKFGKEIAQSLAQAYRQYFSYRKTKKCNYDC